jgi:acetyltransferase-like isoleucine patch superfamily enzyme
VLYFYFILTHSTIDINAELQENVFLSPRCFVSHHVKIKRHTFCGASVKLAGYSEVGERCFLGINTTVIDGVKIGDNVQTAAGAVVTKDVRPDVLIAGVPAIIKKELLSNDVGTENKNEKLLNDGNARKT